MKKEYSAPVVEKIAFNYRDQVVAASSTEEFTEQGGSGQYSESGSIVCGLKYATEYLQFISGCIV